MFTPETFINTVETAKLNAVEKAVTNKTLAENIKAAIRAEAAFAKTIAATTKNIADEVVHFKYEDAFKPVTKFFEQFTSLKK